LQKTVLENGISVLSEQLPHFNSVSVGIWFKVGSRDERDGEKGICHFIEHTVFKGTKNRTASQIVKEIEAVGGTINAFTTKEYVCFHARVLGKDLSLALSVLSDLVRDPLFDPEELEREKGVVIQEIKMTEDTPEEHVYELFFKTFWKDHPLGFPIAGEESTVKAFTSEQVMEFYKRHFSPDRMIVVAAGSVEHEELLEMVVKELGTLQGRNGEVIRDSPKEVQSGVKSFKKDLEQVHLCLGVEGVSQTHSLRFPLLVLNTILGGNMSSRLFQELREKRGLSYAVYSFLQSFTDSGVFGLYVGTTPQELSQVLELIKEQWQSLSRGEIKEEEVRLAKEYLKGGLLISLESPEGWMNRLAKNEIYYGREIKVEETLSAIESVDLKVLKEVGEAFLGKEPCAVFLGEVEENCSRLW
jgi:predicted Zn-dependent peptidase